MILGREKIYYHWQRGEIVCDPMPENIEGCHLDVRIGEWYWSSYPKEKGFVNIHLSDADPRDFYTLKNDGGVIRLAPWSVTLAHTIEYVGTTVNFLQPNMSTRSTFARWGLGVHFSAGWGDPGYCSRWTMEIHNPHNAWIWIPVGARVGCVSFHDVDSNSVLYDKPYNQQRNDWTPDAMLPRIGNW
jgi:dCTP deaminase